MTINRQALDRLIENSKEDAELLEAVEDALKSFEDYHTAIYSMETRKKILRGTVEAQRYQEEITGMDRKRTDCHNAVLANVSMLNRMAAMMNLPPVYDGTISREYPYRRQAADAVLQYVQEIILERP